MRLVLHRAEHNLRPLGCSGVRGRGWTMEHELWQWVAWDRAAWTRAVSWFRGGCLQCPALFALTGRVSWLAAPNPAGACFQQALAQGYVCRIPLHGRIFLPGA